MTVLSRNTITLPTLHKEAVPVPALGGDVIVRAMLASENLALGEEARRSQQTGSAFGDEYMLVPRLLSKVVIDADGEPLMTAQEWQVFGGSNPGVIYELFSIARRLSGGDVEEARKNSEASLS